MGLIRMVDNVLGWTLGRFGYITFDEVKQYRQEKARKGADRAAFNAVLGSEGLDAPLDLGGYQSGPEADAAALRAGNLRRDGALRNLYGLFNELGTRMTNAYSAFTADSTARQNRHELTVQGEIGRLTGMHEAHEVRVNSSLNAFDARYTADQKALGDRLVKLVEDGVRTATEEAKRGDEAVVRTVTADRLASEGALRAELAGAMQRGFEAVAQRVGQLITDFDNYKRFNDQRAADNARQREELRASHERTWAITGRGESKGGSS
ncbi:MAG: hypothetical protein HY512_04285 [Candidatus Aenigmarchaeota archaeon]|nr:hypothetical protein [Candidatus Aenigmarchaeota archaeon]